MEKDDEKEGEINNDNTGDDGAADSASSFLLSARVAVNNRK